MVAKQGTKQARQDEKTNVTPINAALGNSEPAGVETVLITPGGKELSKGFIRDAIKADEEIVEVWDGIGRQRTKFGRLLLEFKTNGYFLALGFTNIGHYCEERFQKSASTGFEAMRIVKELIGTGPGQLPAQEIDKLTKENAGLLSRLSPEKRTPEVFDAARRLPSKVFQQEIVAPLVSTSTLSNSNGRQDHAADHETGKTEPQTPAAQTTTPEPEAVIKIGPYMVIKRVADVWARAVSIMRWQASRLEDGQNALDVLRSDEKVLYAIGMEIEATYGVEYEEMLAVENEKAEQAAANGSRLHGD